MVEGRCTFGVAFTIPKGRRLTIHCIDSDRSLSKLMTIVVAHPELIVRLAPVIMSQIEVCAM